jgi:hypothetical protein
MSEQAMRRRSRLLSGMAVAAALIFIVISIGQTGCKKADEGAAVPNTAPDVVGRHIEFKAGGNSESYQVSGWSGGEAENRWTEGTVAKLELPISATPGALKLRMTMAALTHEPDLPFQPVEVYANGQKLADWEVGGTATEFTAMIPADITSAGGKLTLEFRIPKATSPKSIGMSTDPRVLGIFVRDLDLTRP